jgi:asparagine synthetase B (glutamine-hydrolysing)
VLLMGHGGDDLLRGSSLACAERLRAGDLSVVGEVARHARSQREPLMRSLYRYFGRPHLPARADFLLRSMMKIQQRELLPSWINRRNEALRPQRIFANPVQQDIYENLLGVPWYWRLVNWHERSAASFGIEVRHPFLDRRLFEYVLAIPGEQLFRLGWSKNLLRRSMTGILPEKIRLRERKTRFTAFLDFAMKGRGASEIQEIVRDPLSADLRFLERKSLNEAYLRFLDQGTDETRRALWYAITLEIWLRRCEPIRSRRREALARRSAA